MSKILNDLGYYSDLDNYIQSKEQTNSIIGRVIKQGRQSYQVKTDLGNYNSKISGKLKPKINEIDIFKALFPGGSITGAPKESAMKIIDQLENYSRELYTGSIGYITSDDKMDFNIATNIIFKIIQIFIFVCQYFNIVYFTKFSQNIY